MTKPADHDLESNLTIFFHGRRRSVTWSCSLHPWSHQSVIPLQTEC